MSRRPWQTTLIASCAQSITCSGATAPSTRAHWSSVAPPTWSTGSAPTVATCTGLPVAFRPPGARPHPTWREASSEVAEHYLRSRREEALSNLRTALATRPIDVASGMAACWHAGHQRVPAMLLVEHDFVSPGRPEDYAVPAPGTRLRSVAPRVHDLVDDLIEVVIMRGEQLSPGGQRRPGSPRPGGVAQPALGCRRRNRSANSPRLRSASAHDGDGPTYFDWAHGLRSAPSPAPVGSGGCPDKSTLMLVMQVIFRGHFDQPWRLPVDEAGGLEMSLSDPCRSLEGLRGAGGAARDARGR